MMMWSHQEKTKREAIFREEKKSKQMVNTKEANKFWMQHYSNIFVPKYYHIFF